ncbi:hypothetical protein FF2_031234 [Malus domestica]
MENSEETVVSIAEHCTAEATMRKLFLVIWKRIFIISCVFALFLDPLFLYIPIINEDVKCLELDKKLKNTALVLRSFTDLFYIANVIIQIYFEPKARPFRVMGKSYCSTIVLTKGAILVEDALDLAKWIWRSHILIDILALLPIPQVLIFIFFTNMRGFRSRMVLNSLVLFQYVLRVLRIYLSCKQLENHVQSVFKFFTFILASHVFGALWYFFSIQRVTDCWQFACRSTNGCEASSFDCNDHPFRNITLVNSLCPINPPNATLFDFGIFLDALQSDMLRSSDFPQKFLHCFWWGLRNLSSFGQNLQTSTYAWEDLFAIFISIIGMLLFLIYLNGIMQTYMLLSTERSKEQRKLMKMERKRGPAIASWLHNNDIPLNMNKMIMSCALRELDANKDVNVENILSVGLPLECLKLIKRHLCLATLKKVPVLQAMDDEVLRKVCDGYLKPMIYNENKYIIREMEPIEKMLFITQGTVRIYNTSNIGGSGFSRTSCLVRGDFHGEELLNWALYNVNVASSSDDLPISTRIVKCSTKVEGFTLMANDLRSLVSEFWTNDIDNPLSVSSTR